MGQRGEPLGAVTVQGPLDLDADGRLGAAQMLVAVAVQGQRHHGGLGRDGGAPDPWARQRELSELAAGAEVGQLDGVGVHGRGALHDDDALVALLALGHHGRPGSVLAGAEVRSDIP